MPSVPVACRLIRAGARVQQGLGADGFSMGPREKTRSRTVYRLRKTAAYVFSEESYQRRLIQLALLLTAGALFLWGADRQATLVNTNLQRNDQSAYLDYAKQLAQTDFQYVGDRNRMPLYPGLMALFYQEGMSDAEFFALGKRVGIAMGLVVLLVAFTVFN